jgi:hypothetical protein
VYCDRLRPRAYWTAPDAQAVVFKGILPCRSRTATSNFYATYVDALYMDLGERLTGVKESVDEKSNTTVFVGEKSGACRKLFSIRHFLIFAAVIFTGGLTFLFVTFVETSSVSVGPACDNNCRLLDHSRWTNILKTHVKKGMTKDGIPLAAFEYQKLLKSGRHLLDEYLAYIAKVDLLSVNYNGRLALFLNAYNAFAVDMVLSNLCDTHLCSSILSVPNVPFGQTVWKWKRFTVGGHQVSLDNIEHGLVRPTYKTPLVHAGMNCASVSCPDLHIRAYEEKTVFEMLANHSKFWLANEKKGSTCRNQSPTIKLSKIFDWYKADFEGYEDSGMLGFLEHFGGCKDPRGKDIEYLDYNWDLNGT